MPYNLVGPQVINSVFKKPIYRVLEKIKNEPILSGQIEWEEIPLKEIRIYTISTTRTEVIPPRIVGPYKPSLISQLKLAS